MAKATNNGFRDPEDMFHHTRMSLGDHIEELRRHMIKALIGFGVAMCVGLYFGDNVLRFIAYPVDSELAKMRKIRLDKIREKHRGDMADGANHNWAPLAIFVP